MGSSLKRLVVVGILSLISLIIFAFPKEVRGIIRAINSGSVATSIPTVTPSSQLFVCIYNPEGVLVNTGLSLDNAEGMTICSLSSGVYVPVSDVAPSEGGATSTPAPYWETSP